MKRFLIFFVLLFSTLTPWAMTAEVPVSTPQTIGSGAEKPAFHDVDHAIGLDDAEPFSHEHDLFEGKDRSNLSEQIDLTFEDTVDMALRNQLIIRLAHEKIQESEGKKWQLASELLPHLIASISEERTGRRNLEAQGFKGEGLGSLTGPYNTFDARFELTQKILDLSALSRFQAGRVEVTLANYQEKFAHQRVVLIAAMAYLEALRSFGEFKAAQADRDLALRLFTQAKHQQEAGIATGVDVARADTRVAQENLRLERTRTDVHDAYLDLQRVTGLEYSSIVRLMNSLAFIGEAKPSIEEAAAQALNDRIEIQISNETIRADKFKLYAARTEMLPKFDVVGDYGLSGNKPDDSARETGAVLFRISMPLFEGGKHYGEIKEAKSQKKQEEINLDDLKRQIEEDVHKALWTMETNIEQVKAASKVVLLATRELELANHRFTQGVGDNVEVVNAQTTLAGARETYISALAQYHVARMNLYFALGKSDSFYLKEALPEKR